MPLQRAIAVKFLPARFAFVQPNGGMGRQMVLQLYSLVISFATNITGIFKFLFMVIFDMKFQTKSTFKFFPQPFDMLIQVTFDTSVITAVFAVVDMTQVLWYIGRYIYSDKLEVFTFNQCLKQQVTASTSTNFRCHFSRWKTALDITIGECSWDCTPWDYLEIYHQGYGMKCLQSYLVAKHIHMA